MKIYLCGKCGKINEHGEGGLCTCGADYWLEKEDLKNPELINYVKTIMKNLHLTHDDIVAIFFKKDPKEDLLNKMRRIVYILFDYKLDNMTLDEVEDKIKQILIMPDFESLTWEECLEYWIKTTTK